MRLYQSEIASEAIKFAEKDLKPLFSYNSGNSDYGYITCRLNHYKVTLGGWGLIPLNIATLLVPTSLGCPLCWGNYRCDYIFSIHDCDGNIIRSYSIQTKSRDYCGLWQLAGDLTCRPQMSSAFKKAMAEFEKKIVADQLYITLSLHKAKQNSTAKCENGMAHITKEKINVFGEYIPLLTENPRQLIKELDNIIRNDPDNYPAIMYRAMAKYNASDYTGALEDYTDYARVNPTCEIAHPLIQKATLLCILNHPFEGQIEARKATLLEPKNPDAFIAYGRACNTLGLYDTGIKALYTATHLNPNLTYLYSEIKQAKALADEISTTQAEHEQFMHAQANRVMSQMSAAQTNAFNTIKSNFSSIQTSNYPTHSSGVQNKNENSRKKSPSTKQEECSFCHGTGKNPAKERPPFYSHSEDTHENPPCDICGSRETHYHKDCPSCRGTGKITRLKLESI